MGVEVDGIENPDMHRNRKRATGIQYWYDWYRTNLYLMQTSRSIKKIYVFRIRFLCGLELILQQSGYIMLIVISGTGSETLRFISSQLSAAICIHYNVF